VTGKGGVSCGKISKSDHGVRSVDRSSRDCRRRSRCSGARGFLSSRQWPRNASATFYWDSRWMALKSLQSRRPRVRERRSRALVCGPAPAGRAACATARPITAQSEDAAPWEHRAPARPLATASRAGARRSQGDG
jgi:hypothetical protein